MVGSAARELLVHDGEEPCPYLPGRVARMPLRYPLQRLDRAAFDAALARGDRRCGTFLYRTQCPACSACEPIRVLTSQFVASRTQQRILRKGDLHLRTRQTAPAADVEHVALFNRHRLLRGLSDTSLGERQYASFLVDTCCETFELQYWLGERLIGVAVNDRGANSISAVYCYYDPDYARFSPGTYSILKLIELCRAWRVPYLYLGLYVADSRHMAYKANFRPHERLIRGRWQ